MCETALVVVVPEAEAFLAAHRREPLPGVAPGVPAHVSVLYPFRSVVDDAAAAVIGAHASSIPAFDVTFARAACFPGGVLYLVPEPARPFRDLTVALAAEFPDCPPYGGEHDEVVPHLTVATDIGTAAARIIEDDLASAPPIVTRVSRLTLLRHDAEHAWHAVREWPLAPALCRGSGATFAR
ncbi:MAG: 2'-5' RNA ligase family protein [Desertimonas sp.]